MDLSELHIRFTIWSATTQSPKHTTIRVYNVADATAKRLQQEFQQVFLQAGYGDNVGQIFSGAIKQIRKGRENATDTFIDIIAADGDEAYNWSVVNTTLAAGWSQTDYHGALIQSMSPYGVTAGYVPQFASTQLPRGKVCYGMTRDYMRQLAGASGTQWTVQDGRLHMIPVNGVMPGQSIVITSATGMVGIPTQTVDGILVKCLLNPNIIPGGRIQIDNASVQQIQFDVSYGAVSNFYDPTSANKNTGLDADGFYKVYAMTQTGDTRGPAFYTDMICAAVNGTQPLTSTYTNAVVNGQQGG
ncbi:phage protein [Paraburkholderia antibiotica]|uniref:phage protein n=1 Tax=Paraburkholderia antibiotica TaxID=2728839 RepID=UPI001E362E2E|nr:hypothetical protein [Paraburkholderia antibiotica]